MEELNVKEVASKEGKDELKVTLDTKLTKELLEEMKIRDYKKYPGKRKEMGLNLTQKVNVYLDELPTDTKLVH